MINMRCKDCGKEENLQEHHTSYEPEVTVILCKECHGKRHGTEPKGMAKGSDLNRYKKIPSEETGTFSIYNTIDDRDRIQYLGLEGIGASKVWTRSLEDAETLRRIKGKREQFYEGRITLGELFQELSKI